jgi:Flp pilus assembly protein CpaB
MTYRLRNIVIAVVLAVFAALLTMMYVTNYQRHVDKNVADVPVLVATEDIPSGTSGTQAAQHVEERMVEQQDVAPGAVSDPELLKTLVVSQAIYGGEQVTRQRFSSATEIGVRSQLEGNMRAVAVNGDAYQLLAGTLKGGDRVDVVASLKIDPDKDVHATRIILRDLQVLKPAASPGAESRLQGGNGGENFSVLLAVSDTQVQKLFHVMKHGDWTLQLRPVVDAVDSPETLETVASLMRDGLRRGRR